MTTLNLRDIQLGSPAAERDTDLRDYFIESDAFHRVATGPKRIVIGSRGSGKSAIFQQIAQRERAKPNASVIELKPDEYSYELLRETMLSEAHGSWQKQSAYSAAWKYLLYILSIKTIVERNPKPAKKSALAKLKNYIRDNHQGGQHNGFASFISYLKRLEGVKVGKYEAGMRVRELQKLYKLEELEGLIPHLREALEQHSITIFVDELDRGWDESEDAKSFVAGLFQACQALNRESPNMRLFMSLRQELYDNIPALYEDAQKVRDITETMRWDESGLRRLMARRIQHAIKKGLEVASAADIDELSDDELWKTLFVETLAYRQNKSFNYLIDRTLHRPREIIQFCNDVVTQAVDEDRAAPLDYETIVKAERNYSESRGMDIAAEYRFQYPDLITVFEEFRGKAYSLERSELQELCVEIITRERPGGRLDWLSEYDDDGLIQVLWRVGFLKAHSVGGIKGQARSGSSYLGAYQVRSLDLLNVSRFQVHPMYRSWLSMREAKGSSRSASRP